MKRVSLVSTLAICLAAPISAKDVPTSDTVLAVVNSTEITLGHIISIVGGLTEQYDDVPAEKLYEGILDQLIQQTLLSEVTEVSEKTIQLALDNERRALISTIAIAKIGEAAVTDEAVQKRYDETIATGEPTPEFQAAHILFEKEEEAQAVLKLLNDGGDFGALAKEHSTGPSGPSGGDLGWFGRGAMVPEFDQAVAEMKAGEVAGPVKTQFGYHLIRLNDQRDYPPLESHRAELQDQIANEAIVAEIERLQNAASVERIAPTFDFSQIRNTTLLD
jgi:peptidyl-prolyl cis-trans isomerase C